MEKKLYEYHMDETANLFLLIKSAEEKTTRNGKPYLAFTFQDTSGEMSANFWDASEEDIKMFRAGTVVKVSGKREEYKGSPQLRINSIRLAADGEPANPELYVERAPIKKEKMIEQFNKTIFDITNANMNRIVRHVMNKYQKDFFQSPAAKTNHHAFLGGLAFHTISMLGIARSITDQYKFLDQSLLFSGLILHDIGKVIELTGPTATEYTLEGKLIGHIVIVHEEISKACQQLKIDETNEDVILLKHMVLAHHGEYEYGSPVRPQVPEAEVLYYIDQIDARLNMMQSAMNKTEKGSFSDRIWAMENRSFYKSNLSDLSL
ncbi:3'-5' exonuclease [Marinilactibacillus sp. 15R]|uniref:3'-5' exoribonuclease n=1 Tax=Marinilactibacillus piezotolerans TaxID=258723 RepID=A0A1I4ABU4_9LACT|nr:MULTISPECIES: HD domain-containing protein [Marinilactibacillus]API89087.1 3'-5' exonuclease [Marinilactibacillus sp. 15R]SFK53431.1 3'-5' exoribonuclease [Marinilactibacillus piezotolerans]